jgi:hypothetical protein
MQNQRNETGFKWEFTENDYENSKKLKAKKTYIGKVSFITSDKIYNTYIYRIYNSSKDKGYRFYVCKPVENGDKLIAVINEIRSATGLSRMKVRAEGFIIKAVSGIKEKDILKEDYDDSMFDINSVEDREGMLESVLILYKEYGLKIIKYAKSHTYKECRKRITNWIKLGCFYRTTERYLYRLVDSLYYDEEKSAA